MVTENVGGNPLIDPERTREFEGGLEMAPTVQRLRDRDGIASDDARRQPDVLVASLFEDVGAEVLADLVKRLAERGPGAGLIGLGPEHCRERVAPAPAPRLGQQ